jgi:uncharacterized protein
VFDWDEANIRHIAGHGVTPEEAEQVFNNDPSDPVLQMYKDEERYFQYGITDVYRVLVVVTTWRGEDLIRVVTAYPAPPAIRRKYLRERGL